MSADYRDLLTDLGISDRVVEEIQALNEECVAEAINYSQSNPDKKIREYSGEIYESEVDYYLRTEGFIK